LGMLEEARAKNAYREFHQMIMGETLGFTTDSFNAVISVGVLTLGHAPASSLDELERVKSSFDLCYLIECSSKYEMKGFTPTTESHGVSRGAPSASRIMIGLHFSSSIKIWGTHPHFSLLLFYSFFVTCESK